MVFFLLVFDKLLPAVNIISTEQRNSLKTLVRRLIQKRIEETYRSGEEKYMRRQMAVMTEFYRVALRICVFLLQMTFLVPGNLRSLLDFWKKKLCDTGLDVKLFWTEYGSTSWYVNTWLIPLKFLQFSVIENVIVVIIIIIINTTTISSSSSSSVKPF